MPKTDVIAEGVRIVEAVTAGGATARLIGGVAIAVHASRGLPAPLARDYADVDIVTTKSGGGSVMRVLATIGYLPNERFNALNGHRRLVAYDEAHDRRIDVFVGEFRMCHVIPVARRLNLERHTIPLAELLATKLQIVELNAKDIKDVLALFVEHDVADHDADAINGDWLARLLSSDWGLWRTSTDTLATVREHLPQIGLTVEEQDRIAQRIDTLISLVNATPKSFGWKARSRLGTRAKWYDEPEEIAHASSPTA